MPYIPVYVDPKQLKRDVRGVVLCVVAFIATVSVVSTIVLIAAVFIEYPELVNDLMNNAVRSTGGSLGQMPAEYDRLGDAILSVSAEYAGLASILGMICGLPWFFTIRGKNLLTKDVTRVHSRVKPGTIALMLVFILGIQCFMTLLQLGLEPLFNQSGSSLTDTLEDTTVDLATSFWGVLYIVILGPIFEELVFRGAVMRKLERYGANFAIVISALLFGLYHIILFQAAFAFLIGLVLAYTAGRFSLKWSILLHMINNGLAVLTVFLGSEAFDMALNICYMLALAASILILILGRRYLQAQKQAGAPSHRRVFARAFCSPWLILYIVLCVLGGVSLMIV